jgi:hypothetical protein
MAAFEVIALDTATPQLRAPGAADTYTHPRQSLFLAGTAAAPGIAGNSDDNTGMLWPAADTLAWATGGSEQMRLTSTGLGIGTSSPGAKLHTVGASGAFLENTAGGFFQQIGFRSGVATFAYYDSLEFGYATGQGFSGYTATMRLTSSGNLGLGVTPSAWGGGFKSYDLTTISYSDLGVTRNAYWDGSAYVYRTTAAATHYQMGSGGSHVWYISTGVPSAGSPISFTQAMTLNASGRLLIGQTADQTLEVVRVSGSGQASLLLDNTGKTNGSFVGVFNDAALFGVNRNPATGVFYNASNYAAEVVAVGSSSTSYIAFGTAAAPNTVPTERARIPATGGMVIGTAALATTATDGFLYVPTCAGTPTGTPTTQTGTAPIVINTTNNKLYFYSGGAWRDAGP